MVKNIVKEIIIMLLLCIAIILVMGLVFYGYIPTNETIPNKVAYEVSNEIKSEIQEPIQEESAINIVYQLDASEMRLYNDIIDTGKQDPFAQSSASDITDTENTATNSISNNTNINTNSYLPNRTGK